jgi:predicted extracellular nuclease
MNRVVVIGLLIICSVPLWGQEALPAELQTIIEHPRYLRVMFYNCENYFDIENDSLKNDDEFTPDGEKHWTKDRYYDKQSHISKVITAVGGWIPPDLVGLCEVENRKVLTDLIYNSNLYRLEYKLIHKESPDPRGIDVALLYQPKKFKPVHNEFIAVKFPGETKNRTRDILYVEGLTNEKDTLHVFVNHWPSRWGGMMETEENRMFAASIVKHKTDSIFKIQPNANIIIMGDLNDYPDNKSLTQSLAARHDFERHEPGQLYDLGSYLQFTKGVGSHKYDGRWGVLDHIIVSGSMLNPGAMVYSTVTMCSVLIPPFCWNPMKLFWV